jgi:2-polyprenyl-3-methyl-5-hydroxy-6-metoxy-1,4-benzoquinol methylase
MDLTENEIRPVQFEAGKLQALQDDLEWLRQHRDTFIPVHCPACLSARQDPAFEKFSFTFVKCADCRTAYMSPRAPASVLGDFYGRSMLYEYWNRYIFPTSREIRKAKLFRPRVQRIVEVCDRLNIARRLLVEVGAAHGMFCEEALAAKAFDRVVAVEPGQALAETCRSLGIETINLPVEELQGLSGADVLVSFETVEHLFSPRDFLSKCRDVLAPAGLLVLSCPNYEGFDIQVLGTNSESLDAEHINLFNPDAMARMLKDCGFDLLECSTPGELDAELVRTQVLDGRLDITAQPFLKTLLVDRWEDLGRPFQAFLKTNRLSSHMWVVARRA